MIPLIGIVGRKRHGKDTLHTMLRQLSPWPVERFAFGDAVKAEVSAATGIPVHVIEQLKDTFRPALQWWGTEFRREMCHKDYWLPWLDRALERCPAGTMLCVTDVRFENEAERIKKSGGFLVRIVRDLYGEDKDNHLSEIESDRIAVDVRIRNNGTPDELLEKAEGLLRILRIGAIYL
jgi:hypothetical protein